MATRQHMRLMISCGGTGGHFNPGLGVAKRLTFLGGEALLVLGGKHAHAQKETTQSHNLNAVTFSYSRPQKNPWNFLKFLFTLITGFFSIRSRIRKFKPDAILLMGSSVSLPVALAAKSKGIPIFLHDGNAHIGKANRFLSKWAKSLALSFPAENANEVRCKTVLTGLPLRVSIRESAFTKAEAIASLNERFHADFDPEKPVLLVFGGSLGAQKINETFDVDPQDPNVKNLQIIHLAGSGKTRSLERKYKNYPCKVLLREASHEMAKMYAASDVVVCRAGGSSISELAFFGKYALLVPYPYAAEDHQNDNAKFLASGGGAEIVQDRDCSPAFFRSFTSRILADFDSYKQKGLLSKKLAQPDAVDNVIAMLEEGTDPEF